MQEEYSVLVKNDKNIERLREVKNITNMSDRQFLDFINLCLKQMVEKDLHTSPAEAGYEVKDWKDYLEEGGVRVEINNDKIQKLKEQEMYKIIQDTYTTITDSYMPESVDIIVMEGLLSMFYAYIRELSQYLASGEVDEVIGFTLDDITKHSCVFILRASKDV